jgi:hypothetical protein
MNPSLFYLLCSSFPFTKNIEFADNLLVIIKFRTLVLSLLPIKSNGLEYNIWTQLPGVELYFYHC